VYLPEDSDTDYLSINRLVSARDFQIMAGSGGTILAVFGVMMLACALKLQHRAPSRNAESSFSDELAGWTQNQLDIG
jgi:hypothetical protein